MGSNSQCSWKMSSSVLRNMSGTAESLANAALHRASVNACGTHGACWADLRRQCTIPSWSRGRPYVKTINMSGVPVIIHLAISVETKKLNYRTITKYKQKWLYPTMYKLAQNMQFCLVVQQGCWKQIACRNHCRPILRAITNEYHDWNLDWMFSQDVGFRCGNRVWWHRTAVAPHDAQSAECWSVNVRAQQPTEKILQTEFANLSSKFQECEAECNRWQILQLKPRRKHTVGHLIYIAR